MFKTIIFESGGIKCLSYIGVLQKLNLEKQLVNVNKVIGISGGSFVALFLSLGYSVAEITKIFNDGSFSIVND